MRSINFFDSWQSEKNLIIAVYIIALTNEAESFTSAFISFPLWITIQIFCQFLNEVKALT